MCMYCRTGRMNASLKTALKWWCAILTWDLAEERTWEQSERAPVHLFVDARGQPPRCAAVLFVDGACLYTDGEPAQQYLEQLGKREDN